MIVRESVQKRDDLTAGADEDRSQVVVVGGFIGDEDAVVLEGAASSNSQPEFVVACPGACDVERTPLPSHHGERAGP